ncbi:excitatory amino acid transporter-like [Liolophura sinensis]|uniref:excitatory amino acid transporter-like n=1 Tax=Liolophura sinensis TaxID=3198878 RepID=UPI003159718D
MENEPLRGSTEAPVYNNKSENKPKSSRNNSGCTGRVQNNLLLILTVGGILLGIAIGFAVRPLNLSSDARMWLGLPGEIFLRLLKMLILPLIICSVISGTASLNPKSNGKISAIAFTYCLLTNFMSCVIGLVFTLIIKPARFVDTKNTESVKTQMLQTQDIFADLLRNLVPDNIVEACFQQVQTQYKKIANEIESMKANETDGNSTSSQLYTFSKYLGKTDGTNILGLIVVCLLIGIAINNSQEKGKHFLRFFTSATEVVLILLRWLLWYAPLGVFSLITVSLAGIENLEQTFVQLGLFVLTVFVGIVIHQLVFIALILFVLAHRNPYRYLLSISRGWMLAFAATSTAVAIPEMLHACEVSNKIDKRVSRYVVPFCVTLNADGSALYITAAALFVATVTGNSPDVSTTIIVVVLTTVAGLAIPSVPSSSIVTLVVILSSINIPAEAIGFLFTVEWFLDRIRSTSNLFSHTACAAIVYRFCKSDLSPLQFDEEVYEVKVSNLDIHREGQVDNHVDSGKEDGLHPVHIVS